MIIILYLFCIVFVNFMFAHTGPDIGAFLVGIIFVLRDFVQRKIGHYVLLPMIIGCIVSFFMASPIVAQASLVSFVAAELSDWFIYSTLDTEFHRRVLWSSVLGVFVDSLIFYPMVDIPLFPIVIIAWCSKMTAALSVYTFYRIKK